MGDHEKVEEFEKDDRKMLSLKEKSALDLTRLVDVQHCRKSEIDTHSADKLRKHERSSNKLKHKNNHGIQNDIQSILYLKGYRAGGRY
jgi:hypothetical protein